MCKIEDEYQKQCDHDQWIKLCIRCGAVLEENIFDVKTSTAKNKITYLEIGSEESNAK